MSLISALSFLPSLFLVVAAAEAEAEEGRSNKKEGRKRKKEERKRRGNFSEEAEILTECNAGLFSRLSCFRFGE